VTVDRVGGVDIAVPQPLAHVPERLPAAQQRRRERVPQAESAARIRASARRDAHGVRDCRDLGEGWEDEIAPVALRDIVVQLAWLTVLAAEAGLARGRWDDATSTAGTILAWPAEGFSHPRISALVILRGTGGADRCGDRIRGRAGTDRRPLVRWRDRSLASPGRAGLR
jgi:hypothetical protein